jgi:hypothetical protein
MLSTGTTQRLATQLDCLALIVRDVPLEKLTRPVVPGKWSAHENLSHLARYQRVFLDGRVRPILDTERPQLSRYRSEDDPEWPRWSGMTIEDTLIDLTAGRKALVERVASCTDHDLARVGVHPAFGVMTLSEWLDFFLIHEAHHLYIAMTQART